MWNSVYIIGLFLAAALANEEDFRIIDSISQEEGCRTVGGVCTVAGDCPKGQLSEEAGLCPQQRKKGVECCYGVSMKETRCIKHGGVCLSADTFCDPQLVFKGAKDCPDTHRCCIMTL